MEKEEFERLLLLATDRAKQFALNFIKNELPVENAYNLQLSIVDVDYNLAHFDAHIEGNKKIIKMANSGTVIAALLRDAKVPVWIDISVSEIIDEKTILNLLCANKYSENKEDLYYHQLGLGPFGIKSPNLPVDYIEGVHFKLPEKKKSVWHMFQRKRR